MASSFSSGMTTLEKCEAAVEARQGEVKECQAEVKECQAQVQKLAATGASASSLVFKVADQALKDAKKRLEKAEDRLAKAEDHQRTLELRVQQPGPRDNVKRRKHALPCLHQGCEHEQSTQADLVKHLLDVHSGELDAKISTADPNVGDVVTVPCVGSAGLRAPGGVPSAELWLRRESLEVLEFLEKPTRKDCRVLHVRGFPGTGKSTTGWYWCLRQAKKGKTVLWIHVPRYGPPNLALVKGDRLFAAAMSRAVLCSNNLLDISAECDRVVLDGFTGSPHDKLLLEHLQAAMRSNLRIISSVAINVHVEDMWDSHCVKSFELQDYLDMCQNDVMWQFVRQAWKTTIDEDEEMKIADSDADGDRQDAITEQHFISGGCARYFFLPATAAAEEIESVLKTVPNYKDLASALGGAQAKDSVSHCFQRISNGSNEVDTIVSQFACRLLGQYVQEDFVKMANTLSLNPSIDGWIMELDFTHRVCGPMRTEECVSGLLEDNKPTGWRRDGLRKHFWDAGDIDVVADGAWWIPRRWNQGCFDFIHLRLTEQGWEIHFVQVTRSDTHSALIYKLYPLFQRFSTLIQHHQRNDIASCYLDFVVPKGKSADFKLPKPPTTRDEAWFKHKNVTFSPQYRILEFERTV